MSFTVFKQLFENGYEDLKKRHKTHYAWEKFFLDITERDLCLPTEVTSQLPKFIRRAFEDKLEGSDERDRFEAIMLCIVDFATNQYPSGRWPEQAFTAFMCDMQRSHFDAYLLYQHIKRKA